MDIQTAETLIKSPTAHFSSYQGNSLVLPLLLKALQMLSNQMLQNCSNP